MKIYRIETLCEGMDYVDWCRAENEADAIAQNAKAMSDCGFPDSATFTVREATEWESQAIGVLE